MPTFYQCLLALLFINKTLQINDLKTKTAMNAKISVFVICVDATIIYYITCMTVPLTLSVHWFLYDIHLLHEKDKGMTTAFLVQVRIDTSLNISHWPFSACGQLKGHTYLNKSTAESVCVAFQWPTGTKQLTNHVLLTKNTDGNTGKKWINIVAWKSEI